MLYFKKNYNDNTTLINDDFTFMMNNILVLLLIMCVHIPASFCFVGHENNFHRCRSKRLVVKPPSLPNHLVQSNKHSFLKAFSHDEKGDSEILPDEKVSRALALLLVSQFLLFIGVGAVIPSIPLYGKELGFSSSANGIVISAPAVALLALSKFGGNYADQGRKNAMIIGMATIAVSDLGTAWATSLPVLVVARLGLGAGRCLSESGERGLLADLANKIPSLRGRALAAQQAALALGIAIGAPLGGIVVEEYGPRAAFLCVSTAATVAFVLYLFLPETVTDTNESKLEKEAESIDWAELWTENQWRALALCQSGASFGFAAKIASIPVLAASILPGGAVGSGALLSAAGLSGLLGAPLGGWLSDRTGSKTTIILSGFASACCLAMVPVAINFQHFDVTNVSISIGDTSLSGNALAFVVFVLGWSTAAAAQGPALIALAQELAPAGRESTALALPRAAGDATYIFAPFLLGLVTDFAVDTPGIECAAAGIATFLGLLAIILL